MDAKEAKQLLDGEDTNPKMTRRPLILIYEILGTAISLVTTVFLASPYYVLTGKMGGPFDRIELLMSSNRLAVWLVKEAE